MRLFLSIILIVVFALPAGLQAQNIEFVKDRDFTVIDGRDVMTKNYSMPAKFEGDLISYDLNNTYTNAVILGSNNMVSWFDYAGTMADFFSVKSLANDDNTRKIYMLNNEQIMIRSNVTQFDIYDRSGSLVNSASVSSKAKQLESQAVMDEFGQTVFLYNPKVITDSGISTSAYVLNGARRYQKSDSYYYSDHTTYSINYQKDVDMFVAILHHENGSSSKVVVLDKNGDTLLERDYEMKLIGATITQDLVSVAVYSDSRMAAYNLITNERLGSSSISGNPLRYATYNPVNSDLVGVTGMVNGERLTNLGIQAVNVKARKIERREVDESFRLHEGVWSVTPLSGNHRYRLINGTNVFRFQINYD